MVRNIVGEGKYFLAGEYLSAIRDYAISKGISAKSLLNGTQIPIDSLLYPPSKIGEESMYRLGSNLINEVDNLHSASIEYGQCLAMNAHGPLGLAISGAKNLNEVAFLLVQYIQTRSNFIEFELLSVGDFVNLRMKEHSAGTYKIANHVEFFYFFSTLINMALIGEKLLSNTRCSGRFVINMDCPHVEIVLDNQLSSIIELNFSQPHIEICVPREWMDIPFSSINSDLTVLAEEHCKKELSEAGSKGVVPEIRKILKSAQKNKPTLDEMAAYLHMSTSKLQRKLKELNTTYQSIKSEEIAFAARELLLNSKLSIDEIAEQLGFNNASNFSKSFKAYEGVTPNKYRKRQRTL
ncbi:hypothetical protein A9Q81_23060 [Gammaproteobacteria bacterium 42_54_T18]|nr:hypothetical protein A9Q81_23060 [Gammaproteobacteria bacterium 42_54_T18]